MGRKSSALEKKRQIVETFTECVVDLGIDRVSMGEVASRMGIDRSTMHYYFRTREDLVVEATQHITQFYVDKLKEGLGRLNPQGRLRSLVELLFSAGFHDEKRSSLLDELSTLGNREPFFQEQVLLFYKSLENFVHEVYDESLPNVPEKDRRFVSATIGVLAEGTTVYMSLGFSKAHRLAARQVALKLVDDLIERQNKASGTAKEPSK